MIVNPVSGGMDKSEFIHQAANFAAKENLNFVLYETCADNDTAKIKALYKKFIPERIIVAGGDGTIKLVAEALESEEFILGILPAGSANGLATDLGLPKTIDESLSIAFRNDFLEIDMIVVNGKKSLHLSDLGLNATLIKNYEEGSMHGRWHYALQAFKTLINTDVDFSATITTNSEVTEYQARMIVIANSKKYGTGVVINPNGIMNDGKFEIIILKNLDFMVFGKIITGNMPLESDDISIISTDKATIKTNFPVSFQMDGEYYGAEAEFNISIAPKKLKVAVP
ncbi:transcription regulator protein [Flavobacterium frigoris PS1]|uniref:Transcription regulator protein n=2 Tax=Flavobacterium frigoris TaxID=229204 RepID=H7FQQ4_FLAFP|nr:transcription regulator protein [Flavobacterium frigoris PS1]